MVWLWFLNLSSVPGAEENFAAEAAAARGAGIPVALIDHDALAEPGGAQRAAARVPDACGGAVWRGCMMTAAQYGALADAQGATRAC